MGLKELVDMNPKHQNTFQIIIVVHLIIAPIQQLEDTQVIILVDICDHYDLYKKIIYFIKMNSTVF